MLTVNEMCQTVGVKDLIFGILYFEKKMIRDLMDNRMVENCSTTQLSFPHVSTQPHSNLAQTSY